MPKTGTQGRKILNNNNNDFHISSPPGVSLTNSFQPKLVQVTLNRSPYGGEDLHDMLTLEYPSGHGFSGVPPALSVPIVLHLVESVLGYRLVYQDATNWHYRRDTPLMRM
ncbi:hypothetical protein E4U59_004717 [Claviceps monticola]|nr:hypothetical protein E4U59_004717 [Claviceps monticola]